MRADRLAKLKLLPRLLARQERPNGPMPRGWWLVNGRIVEKDGALPPDEGEGGGPPFGEYTPPKLKGETGVVETGSHFRPEAEKR